MKTEKKRKLETITRRAQLLIVSKGETKEKRAQKLFREIFQENFPLLKDPKPS